MLVTQIISYRGFKVTNYFEPKSYTNNRKRLSVPSSFCLSSISPHNMVNFGLLEAEIVSLVWGIPANFNGFRVLASLLQRRRSTEANQTLHNIWPLPGLVDYIYTFGGCCFVTKFCQVQNSLCVLRVLRSPIGTAALLHGSRTVGASQTLRR